MVIFFFLVRYIRWIIVYNYFSVSVPFYGTSASLLCNMRVVCHSSPNFRVLKLKCSYSSSKPESLGTLKFLCLFVVRTAFTVLATRAFSSSPSAGRLLSPWNLTRPALLPRAVDKIKFIALACARMNLHEFILWPEPCRGHTGEFLFLIFF